MRRRLRLAVALGAALASGCAGLKSTLPPPAPAGAAVGAPAVVLAPDAAAAEIARLRDALQRSLTEREWTVPVQLAQEADGALRIRLGAVESFEPGSAQLEAAALSVYAAIADALGAQPPVVAHVLVHADTAGVEPAVDLTARRAASLVNYLASRGVPAGRVRGEGRGAAEPLAPHPEDDATLNERVEIVLKPVIAGREPLAWVPPAPAVGCEACGHDHDHE